MTTRRKVDAEFEKDASENCDDCQESQRAFQKVCKSEAFTKINAKSRI